MAIVTKPADTTPFVDDHDLPEAPRPLLARPTHPRGLWGWLTTVDHKKIGILYAATALAFFVIGGFEALLMRIQLGSPNNTFLSADAYNQIFTMHGTTMIFLVVMPLSAGFANYVVPIMVGARDVAFPRLNAFGYWTFVVGGIFMYSSFVLGGAPDGGWFGYAPNTLRQFSPGHRIDFWMFGLQILGIASLTGAVNLIITILNMRAPGMKLMRMPVFAWMTLVAQFLLLFAMPIITVALFLLMFDRLFGSNFFNSQAGSDPLLWQHLFWLFGHPEVYILILPAMGIVSEVLPVFSRKPIFGYPVMVFSGIAIGLMGWGVWAHHMFASGLGPVAVSAFSLSTMFIAVPTGVKIFNWIATVWKGRLRMTTPMLFAIGFVGMFTIGGLSGVTHAVVPGDTQQTDTYYIVAHFHYVLFGGSILGLFAGLYYWFPKAAGRLLNERLGKLHFWLMLVGFNLTFFPFHFLGLQGMPRRIYTYPPNRGWDFWNFVSTMGAFLIAASILVFAYNLVVASRRNPRVGADPWDARTLEWSVSSPPPEHNFDQIPLVEARDDLWHRKYTEDEQGRAVPRHAAPPPAVADGEHGEAQPPVAEEPEPAEEEHPHVHLPAPSYWPLLASIGLAVICYGMIYRVWVVAVLGAIWVMGSLYGWGLEPQFAPEGPSEAAALPSPEPVAEREPEPEPAAPAEPAGPAGTAGA